MLSEPGAVFLRERIAVATSSRVGAESGWGEAVGSGCGGCGDVGVGVVGVGWVVGGRGDGA